MFKLHVTTVWILMYKNMSSLFFTLCWDSKYGSFIWGNCLATLIRQSLR